ncbi:MAG: hypothetical protein ABMA26_19170 [Limisphaerales bacterium]
MQTLTVRELSRETARVLNTCDHEGQVVIRHTDGREYLLAPTQPRRKQGKRRLPDFGKRMRSKFGDRVFSEQFIGAILNKGEH